MSWRFGQSLAESPMRFAERLLASGRGRTWVARDPDTGRYRAADPLGEEIAAFVEAEQSGRGHEAVFLAAGAQSRALFAAFVHDVTRGQAQGGVRRFAYGRLADLLRDGLRLSQGMTRKNALAGLWWGGGKGVIDAGPGELPPASERRGLVYREYGEFVSGLRGCYVTAEDVGTSCADMGEVFRCTRFATCIPSELGGSGNPSPMTAAGVVCAMEAALEFAGLGALENRSVVVQGAGSVGSELVRLLLDKKVARVVVSEVSAPRRAALGELRAGGRLVVRAPRSERDPILAEPCDVLAPCAMGGVLGPGTIPTLQARIVCGAANNPLEYDARDGAALAARGIVYVPDFVANRMGIVCCANEQYGGLVTDERVLRHLSRDWEGGIHQTTLRVLERARRERLSPAVAANQLADELARTPHPLWGDRARRIVASLLSG